MKINVDQLNPRLKKSLPSIIILAGDETLLVQEAFDAILARTNADGYTDRDIFNVNAGFDWPGLLYEAHAPSLFATKRILDCRLSSLKIGDAGSKAFRAYAANPPADTCLIITTPKLDTNAQKSKWLLALEKAGLLVTIWPIDRARLPDWISTRLKKVGLQHTPRLANFIAAQTEGNLLAAQQHIEKLALLQGDILLDEATMAKAITASNHYSVFDLVSSALSGQTERAIRVTRTLQAEKTEITLVLWALCAELRIAAYLAHHSGQKPFADLCRDKGVWQKRQHDLGCYIKRHGQATIAAQLKLAAHIDRIIKGARLGNAWDSLEAFVCNIAQPQEHPIHV